MSHVDHSLTFNDIFSKMHSDVLVIALRGLANSLNARAIYAYQRYMLQEERKARDPSIDSYNEQAAAERFEKELEELRETSPSSLSEIDRTRPQRPKFDEQATMFRRAALYFETEIKTLTNDDQFKRPMSLDLTMEFLTRNAQDQTAFIKAVAEATGIDAETIRLFEEVEAKNEREKLIRLSKPIIQFLNSVGEGSEHTLDHLPPVTQHQLGVKVKEVLEKGVFEVLRTVRRTKKLEDLTLITLIREAITDVKKWGHDFEKLHADAIDEAIATGANLKTFD